jgi:hypothetical protein
MQLEAIVERRRRAVLDLWKSDSALQIMARDEEMIRCTLPPDVPEAVQPLGRRRRRNVFIVHNGVDPDRNASVWVRVGATGLYSAHRDAYAAFLTKVYGIPCDKQQVAALGYQVDHLLNSASVKALSGFVRLEAVAQKVNGSWGAFYEKAVRRSSRVGRKMRWTVASKLAGQLPPLMSNPSVGIERLVRYWVAEGFPREQAAYGLAEDLNPVYGLPPPVWEQPTTRWL